MKKFALAVLPALILASPAFALVGGPWDNNIPGGTQNEASGTYQATITGTDLSGVMIFGTSATSNAGAGSSAAKNSLTGSIAAGLQTSGNEGRVAIFVAGTLVIGEMSAVVDLPGKSISGTLDASRLRSVETLTKDTGALKPITYTYYDVVTASGSFTSKFVQTFPNIVFSGKGKVAVSDPQGVIEVDITATVDDTGSTGSQTTSLRPNPLKYDVPIRVHGVKTSNIAPTFTGSVVVQSATVTSN